MCFLALLAAASAVGPRPIAATFVPLEIDRFPRPADEACADNKKVIKVAPPATIAGALADAGPGSTLLVQPGTWIESRGEPTALVISASNVCLRAAGGGTVVLKAAPGQKYGIFVSGSDTVLEGFTLRGFSTSVELAPPAEGATQRRVTLQRLRIEAPAGEGRDGIVANGDNRARKGAPLALDGLLVLDVRVEGVDLGLACNAGPCAHWWVERTQVFARRGEGDSGADAFAIEEGRQIAIVDSTFRGATADGIDTKASEVLVLGAQVRDVGRNGIKLWRGGDVIDTVVDGTGADAALVGDQPGRYRYLHVLVTHHGGPGDTQYVGTWAYDNPGPGLMLEITNSIFVANAAGGLWAPASATVSLRRSIFADTEAKLLELSDGKAFMVSELAALEASGRGKGNLTAAPRLGNDGTPLPGSPARDAAERVADLVRDMNGGPRVRGAGPDIGPVEGE